MIDVTTKAGRDELRRLIAEATPGPWESHMLGGGKGRPNSYRIAVGPDDSTKEAAIGLAHGGPNRKGGHNAKFIAASREALPAALDRIEELEAILVRGIEQLEATDSCTRCAEDYGRCTHCAAKTNDLLVKARAALEGKP